MAAMFAPTASATLQMTLQSGGTTITVIDNGANDSNGAVGQVTFIGIVGNWKLNVTTGTVGVNPLIDLNSVNTLGAIGGGPPLNGTGVNALTIKFSADNLSSPFATPFAANIGGTLATGHSLTYSAYVDTSNTLFGTGTQIGSTLSFSNPPASFGGSTSGGFVGANSPFALTEVVILSGTANGTSSFDGNIDSTVPEPATMALLGTVLLVSGNAMRRKFRKA